MALEGSITIFRHSNAKCMASTISCSSTVKNSNGTLFIKGHLRHEGTLRRRLGEWSTFKRSGLNAVEYSGFQ